MVATPDTSHVTKPPFDGFVYDPAEDTFTLLDALEQDGDAFRQQEPRLVVEIGSGSGCVCAFMAALLSASSIHAAFLCTDVNRVALRATQQTALTNGKTHFDVVQTSLLDGLLARCRESVDVLLFNPPYVPTTDEEEIHAQSTKSIEGSWAGGLLGTKLVDVLLPQVADLLAVNGRLYLVAIKQNDPDALVRRLVAAGLKADVCFSRRAGREHLFIIRAIRTV